MDRVTAIIIAVIVALTILFGYAYEQAAKECSAKGGVFYSPEGGRSLCLKKELVIE